MVLWFKASTCNTSIPNSECQGLLCFQSSSLHRHLGRQPVMVQILSPTQLPTRETLKQLCPSGFGPAQVCQLWLFQECTRMEILFRFFPFK